MSLRSISPLLQRAFFRNPPLLATAVGAVNWLQRSLGKPNRARAALTLVAITLVATLLALFVVKEPRIALTIQWLLRHWGLVVAVSALFAVSLISRRRRDLEVLVRRSWLIATPGVRQGPRATVALLVSISLMWRIVAGAAATSLVALNGAVTADEALRLAGLLAETVTNPIKEKQI